MPFTATARALHGGASRVVALAARSAGYRSAIACLTGPDQALSGGRTDGLKVITHHGDDLDDLLAAAAAVVAGLPLPAGAVGAPMVDPLGTIVGVLCLGGALTVCDPVSDTAVVGAFAAVLHDQVDLMRVLGPPPDPAAVTDLRAALDHGEIQAWFQPIVSLDDEHLVGFEALARWRTPQGMVSRPGDFVPLAERSGLVDELDLAVLRHGLGHLARWHRTHPALRLSVNISGKHLDTPDWLTAVHAAVVGAGVSPTTIELELTESVRPAEIVRNTEELRQAQELGYEVWFDDFGTGWSELRQLLELPVDGVKVDRFFTEALGGRGDSVVRAVVSMATDLDLDLVVEGVSRREHADRARELGCRLGQGFLWSPAVTAAEVDLVLAGTSSFTARVC